MANDIHQRDALVKNHGAVVLAGTENADVLTYPVPNEGFQQWSSLDHYAKRVLDGRFHKSNTEVKLVNTDFATGSAGDITITYPAAQGVTHGIFGLSWGYNPSPSHAGIEIEDGSGNVVRHIHDARIIGSIDFDPPICNRYSNTDLIVRLHNTAGVTGYLNVEHRLV